VTLVANLLPSALAHLDLDADWDPSKHDVQMSKLYDGGDYDIGKGNFRVRR
jgi:hypothetical protein